MWFRYAEYVWQLYAGRIFAGLSCGGIYVCNTLFVAEIASDWYRFKYF